MGVMCAMIEIWWCVTGQVELLHAIVSTRSDQSWWPSHVGEVTAALSQWTDEYTVASTRMIYRIYILKHGFVFSFLPCGSFAHVSLSLKETERTATQASKSTRIDLTTIGALYGFVLGQCICYKLLFVLQWKSKCNSLNQHFSIV